MYKICSSIIFLAYLLLITITPQISAFDYSLTRMQNIVKVSLQTTAAVTTMGGLCYGSYQFAKALKGWITQSNDKQQAEEEQRTIDKSLLRALAALRLCILTGIVATADWTFMVGHFNMFEIPLP
ncbi:MAG: hypothetical protein NTX86_05605 [Candidatus Dependentiae bacterium]|nr:hypothetical protein [Candidatus Dependentiae bacterium]